MKRKNSAVKKEEIVKEEKERNKLREGCSFDLLRGKFESDREMIVQKLQSGINSNLKLIPKQNLTPVFVQYIVCFSPKMVFFFEVGKGKR
jgi:hypothetical protein